MTELETTMAQLSAMEQAERELDELDEATEGKLLSQDFGVGGPPEKTRPLEVIEAELDFLKQDTRQKEISLLCNYIEIGRRLEEAKRVLPHGQWGDWLKKKEFSQSTAHNFMRLFREYGADQQSLFGGVVKSKTFANLTFSKALSLLAIPDEAERERFVEENDVEHMSVRELNEAIKARDKAEEKAAAAQDEARGLREKLQDSDLEVVEAKAAAREAREALEKQRDKARRLQDALSEANSSVQAAEEERDRLQGELEELRSRPVDVAVEVDQEAVEAARKAAVDEMTEKVQQAEEKRNAAEEKRAAAEEALASARRELDELKARGPVMRELTQEERDALTADAVEQAKAEGAEQLRDLEKQLAAADPDTAAFKVLFDSWQEAYCKVASALDQMQDRARADKLRNAVRAAAEGMQG